MKTQLSKIDINTKFTFGGHITEEQKAFYEAYGFCHFKHVYTPEEVNEMRESVLDAAKKITAKGLEAINGVPIKYGYDEEGNILPQRTPFMNLHSPVIKRVVSSDKLKPLLEFVPNSRMGLDERDGVVINHYVTSKKSTFKKLGWHTDSIRDIFYFEKIRPMLNVGIHLAPSSKTLGGLRIIPGTHKQGLWHVLFGKMYYFDNKADPRELAVECEPGDLTIHDGRLWHRAESPTEKTKGRRMTLYFPILCGPRVPKNEFSKAPFYLRFMSNAKPPKPTT